jgi:hypothetical protein
VCGGLVTNRESWPFLKVRKCWKEIWRFGYKYAASENGTARSATGKNRAARRPRSIIAGSALGGIDEAGFSKGASHAKQESADEIHA